MSGIPDDIKKAADAAWEQINGHKYNREAGIEIIGQAILEERKRAARLTKQSVDAIGRLVAAGQL